MKITLLVRAIPSFFFSSPFFALAVEVAFLPLTYESAPRTFLGADVFLPLKQCPAGRLRRLSGFHWWHWVAFRADWELVASSSSFTHHWSRYLLLLSPRMTFFSHPSQRMPADTR